MSKMITICMHCGADGPWEGVIESINHETGEGIIKPTNCGTCKNPYQVIQTVEKGPSPEEKARLDKLATEIGQMPEWKVRQLVDLHNADHDGY